MDNKQEMTVEKMWEDRLNRGSFKKVLSNTTLLKQHLDFMLHNLRMSFVDCFFCMEMQKKEEEPPTVVMYRSRWEQFLKDTKCLTEEGEKEENIVVNLDKIQGTGYLSKQPVYDPEQHKLIWKKVGSHSLFDIKAIEHIAPEPWERTKNHLNRIYTELEEIGTQGVSSLKKLYGEKEEGAWMTLCAKDYVQSVVDKEIYEKQGIFLSCCMEYCLRVSNPYEQSNNAEACLIELNTNYRALNYMYTPSLYALIYNLIHEFPSFISYKKQLQDQRDIKEQVHKSILEWDKKTLQQRKKDAHRRKQTNSSVSEPMLEEEQNLAELDETIVEGEMDPVPEDSGETFQDIDD